MLVAGIGNALADRILTLRDEKNITEHSFLAVPRLKTSETVGYFNFEPYPQELHSDAGTAVVLEEGGELDSLQDSGQLSARTHSRSPPQLTKVDAGSVKQPPAPYPYETYPQGTLPAHIGKSAELSSREGEMREKRDADQRPRPKAPSGKGAEPISERRARDYCSETSPRRGQAQTVESSRRWRDDRKGPRREDYRADSPTRSGPRRPTEDRNLHSRSSRQDRNAYHTHQGERHDDSPPHKSERGKRYNSPQRFRDDYDNNS